MSKAQDAASVQEARQEYQQDIIEDPSNNMAIIPMAQSAHSSSSSQQSTMLAAASALRKQAADLMATAAQLEACAWEQIPED